MQRLVTRRRLALLAPFLALILSLLSIPATALPNTTLYKTLADARFVNPVGDGA